MVGTICPMVHRAPTKRGGTNVLLTHTIGSLVGASLTGAVAGAVGALVLPLFDGSKSFMLGATAILCGCYVIHELGIIRFPHPQSHKRVPAKWRLGKHSWASWLYGLSLGTGVGTYIPVSMFYIALLWCTAIGKPAVGAYVFVGFGVGRAMPIILLSRCESVDRAMDVVEFISWNLSGVRLINALALTFSGLVLALNSVHA